MAIADAPWIRNAEMYGVDDGPVIECPICGSEHCEEIVLDENDNVLGCNLCTRTKDAYEWYMDLREAERDDYQRAFDE